MYLSPSGSGDVLVAAHYAPCQWHKPYIIIPGVWCDHAISLRNWRKQLHWINDVNQATCTLMLSEMWLCVEAMWSADVQCLVGWMQSHPGQAHFCPPGAESQVGPWSSSHSPALQSEVRSGRHSEHQFGFAHVFCVGPESRDAFCLQLSLADVHSPLVTSHTSADILKRHMW